METPTPIRTALLQAVDILRRGWCRRCPARTAKGEDTDVFSRTASKFCPEGAIRKACAGNLDLLHETRGALNSFLGMPAREWNDWYVKDKRECIRTILRLANSLEPSVNTTA